MSSLDKLENVPCPLCGNEQLEKLAEKGQFELQCHVSICPNDGLVFLSPRWSKERYIQFYSSEYDSYYRPAVLTEETEEQRYHTITQICERLDALKLLEERTSVLDVGAGMGWSLDWMKRNYSQVSQVAAIEASEHCVEHLRNQVGAKVVGTDLESEWSSGPYDLILMRHVLEHTLDPIASLQRVRDNLHPDGIAYVAVPNNLQPKGDLLTYWFRTVHTFYFTESTLQQVAHRAGLEVTEIQCWQSEVWAVLKKPKSLYQEQIQKLRAQGLNTPQ